MKMAAIQMVSASTLQANLESAKSLLQQAAAAGAELAVLPEYFCLLGRRDTDKLALAEAHGDGVIQRFLGEQARALGLWIAGGTLPIATPDPQRVRNALLVFNPAGTEVARYDKIHLFRFDNGNERYDEGRALEAGAQPVLFELASRDGHAWRVGLSVCYDLRFPELYRQLSAQGADLLLVPSAFTHTTGQAHWEVLLRARAIENLAYVAAAAQGGRHENGRQTWGHTMLVDPWGRIVAEQAEHEGVVFGECDAAQVARCRQQLPALEHRRL